MSLYIRYPANAPGSGGGGGGSGSGLVKVDLYDPLTTSVTSGSAIVNPFVVDGVTISTGDTVLFSNLSSGNNEVYMATVTGGSISWAVQSSFNSAAAPTAGDLVIILEGDSFANQIGEFDGTTWNFNNTVRYFNGVDYFEQSALITSTLVDNSSGTVYSVAYLGSENQIIEYSISRAGLKETGTITLTTDGSVVGISSEGSATGSTGVSFSSIISGSDIQLNYTTTSTGSDATMKYNIRRWSDNSGGPGGVPSYSSGAAIIPAAGVTGNIQINSAGVLGASSDLSFDSGILSLGLAENSILISAAIADNQLVPATIITMPVSSSAVTIEYSINKSGQFRTGRMLYATDGSTVSFQSDYVELGTTGIVLSAIVSGGSVLVQYTSTATGAAGTLKYLFRRWAA